MALFIDINYQKVPMYQNNLIILFIKLSDAKYVLKIGGGGCKYGPGYLQFNLTSGNKTNS